jgi:uncharacterized protein
VNRIRLACRKDWKRVTKRKFSVWELDEANFTGYVTRLELLEVVSPLWVDSCGERICVADKGYSWLQHFPQGTQYALTSQWNANSELVQWYFDICNHHGVTVDGIPYWNDLYLDVIGLPSGTFQIIDGDELTQALEQNHISLEQYEVATREAEKLLWQLNTEKVELLGVAYRHHKTLTTTNSVQANSNS